jgi:hypothetical protein
LPQPKGVKRPDIALMNKAREGKKNAGTTKDEKDSIILEKLNAYDNDRKAVEIIAKENGITLNPGWSLLELILELKKAMPKEQFGKAGANALSVLTTTNSADASVKLLKILVDIMADKTIEQPSDEVKPANIIIFGQDDFGGVE